MRWERERSWNQKIKDAYFSALYSFYGLKTFKIEILWCCKSGYLKLLEPYPVRNSPVPEKRHPVFIWISARPLSLGIERALAHVHSVIQEKGMMLAWLIEVDWTKKTFEIKSWCSGVPSKLSALMSYQMPPNALHAHILNACLSLLSYLPNAMAPLAAFTFINTCRSYHHNYFHVGINEFKHLSVWEVCLYFSGDPDWVNNVWQRSHRLPAQKYIAITGYTTSCVTEQ